MEAIGFASPKPCAVTSSGFTPLETRNWATASARFCDRISLLVTPSAARPLPIGVLSVKPFTTSLFCMVGASLAAILAMMSWPLALIVQLPGANSRSLLTVYLMAPMRRVLVALAASISACWAFTVCSSCAFFACTAS